MIKIENIEVFNFEGAIRGLRNPMNSWDKSDSYSAVDCGKCGLLEKRGICTKDDRLERCENYRCYAIGEKDLDLMRRLYKAGTEHRKYLRQIFVSMDITAPRYWFSELDTYKVGTTSNSCSTMHTIHKKEFTADDFSCEQIFNTSIFNNLVDDLNDLRKEFIETKDKRHWYAMIQLLPQSYNQKRTITMNYENVMNIIHQRENHKLDEWREFCEELKMLPYVGKIMEDE